MRPKSVLFSRRIGQFLNPLPLSADVISTCSFAALDFVVGDEDWTFPIMLRVIGFEANTAPPARRLLSICATRSLERDGWAPFINTFHSQNYKSKCIKRTGTKQIRKSWTRSEPCYLEYLNQRDQIAFRAKFMTNWILWCAGIECWKLSRVKEGFRYVRLEMALFVCLHR